MAKRTKTLKVRYWEKAQRLLKLGKLSNFEKYIDLKDRYIIKELLSLGWVQKDNIEMDPRYGYFITNRPLEGKIYVYPIKYADSYQTYKRGKHEDYLKALDNCLHGGPTGYIKYQYSKYHHGS
jgi:hypothetical protein